MKVHLVTRAVFFTLLFPGGVTILGPYLIIARQQTQVLTDLSIYRILAIIYAMIACSVLLHCIWGFAFYGKGTLAPVDPPNILVVHGLYRYTRNPMYLAVVSILLAESLFFQSLSLLAYAAVVFAFFHAFVLRYEEPHLRNRFGRPYVEYCRAVPRWGFTQKSYRRAESAT